MNKDEYEKYSKEELWLVIEKLVKQKEQQTRKCSLLLEIIEDFNDHSDFMYNYLIYSNRRIIAKEAKNQKNEIFKKLKSINKNL